MNNQWTPLYLWDRCIFLSIGYRQCSTRQQLLETAQVQVVEYPRVFHRPPLATGCLTRWMSTRADRSEAVFRGLPVFRELSTSQAVEVYHHLVGSHMVKQPSMVDQPVSHHAGMTRTDESCVLSAFPPVWCNIWRGKNIQREKNLSQSVSTTGVGCLVNFSSSFVLVATLTWV